MWNYVAIGSLVMIGIYKLISTIYTNRINISDILLKADIKMIPDGENSENIRPWDIIIKNNQTYDDFVSGSLGFMESYMKGYWSCNNLEKLFQKLGDANLHNLNNYTLSQLIYLGISRLRIKLMGFSRKDGELVGLQHYDLPCQLYEIMLGPTMTYSCAYFKNTDNLDQAQMNKMDLIARKLHLEPGVKILDIGCGWGTLSNYLVTNYDVEVVAITISKEQFKYCQEKYNNSKLEFKLQDYRDIDGDFDRIVSVGMFEHVTSANYDTYFRACQRVLKPNGLILLHTITGDKSHSPGGGNPFIMKYIFPNSQLPSLSQIMGAVAYKFTVDDVQNFGLYYAKTLEKWRDNFDTVKINHILSKHNKSIGESFIRMWEAYLAMSQIGFETEKIYLHQLVLTKNKNEVYEAVR